MGTPLQFYHPVHLTLLVSQTAPLLILFNKQDLPRCLDSATLFDRLGINEITGRPVLMQPSSNLTGEGLIPGASTSTRPWSCPTWRCLQACGGLWRLFVSASRRSNTMPRPSCGDFTTLVPPVTGFGTCLLSPFCC